MRGCPGTINWSWLEGFHQIYHQSSFLFGKGLYHFSIFLSLWICILSNSNYCLIQPTLQYVTVHPSQNHPVLSNFQPRALPSTGLHLHLLLSLRQHQDLCLRTSMVFQVPSLVLRPPEKHLNVFTFCSPASFLCATWLKNTNQMLYNKMRHSNYSISLWLHLCGYESLLCSCARICCCSI